MLNYFCFEQSKSMLNFLCSMIFWMVNEHKHQNKQIDFTLCASVTRILNLKIDSFNTVQKSDGLGKNSKKTKKIENFWLSGNTALCRHQRLNTKQQKQKQKPYEAHAHSTIFIVQKKICYDLMMQLSGLISAVQTFFFLWGNLLVG